MRAMIVKMSSTTSGARPSEGSSSRISCGCADQRAADRQHLLLAAREVAGQPLARARAGAGSSCRPCRSRASRARAAGQRVASAATRFSSTVRSSKTRRPSLTCARPSRASCVRRAGRDVLRRRSGCGPLATSPFSQRQQARDGLQRGRLAGTVGAQQRDDLPARHVDRQAAQRLHALVVDDLDVARSSGRQPRRHRAQTLIQVARPAPSSSSPGRSW